MTRIKLKGISIDFPYEPYESQKQTMEKILECLLGNSTGMIESPTGTGKSLSILCSVLAYREHLMRNNTATFPSVKRVNVSDTNSKATDKLEVKSEYVIDNTAINTLDKCENTTSRPKIIICSRTHKQLDQLTYQLKKTRYNPRITILASRTQYCIHPKLKNVSDRNTACSDLVKANQCNFFMGKDRLVKKAGQQIFNIEDLVKDGRRCGGCPYFASRKLLEDADVVFAPYNYLLDKNIRSNTSIQLENSIVIIDEAHNIDDVCRSSGSIELTSHIIDIVINELLNAIKKSAYLEGVKPDYINILELFKKLVLNVEKTTKFDKTTNRIKSIIRKGKGIKTELTGIGITCEFMTQVKNALYAILENEEAKSLVSHSTWHVIETLDSIISALLFSDCDVYAYVFNKEQNEMLGRSTFSYNFWLLDGAYVFVPFVKQVKSLVLLSGTLSPFVSFSSELGHKFTHQITALHCIDKSQVSISCLREGHLKQELIGTYKVSESLSYLDQIAKAIHETASKVGVYGGTLVFVPSYSFLENLKVRLKLLKFEGLFCEPKTGGNTEFELVLNKYHKWIQLKKPVVLLCVYRGKASEGVDFKDSSARAVICVGIPYPSFVNTQIELKKEYNDRHKHFNGRRWYETQALRAVNQAVGRAIRHKDDWGIIVMLDSRYKEKRIADQLSGWVNQFMTVQDNYTSFVKSINNFLSDKKVQK